MMRQKTTMVVTIMLTMTVTWMPWPESAAAERSTSSRSAMRPKAKHLHSECVSFVQSRPHLAVDQSCLNY